MLLGLGLLLLGLGRLSIPEEFTVEVVDVAQWVTAILVELLLRLSRVILKASLGHSSWTNKFLKGFSLMILLLLVQHWLFSAVGWTLDLCRLHSESRVGCRIGRCVILVLFECFEFVTDKLQIVEEVV